MPARLRFKLAVRDVQGSFAANTISSRIYLDSNSLFHQASLESVDESDWKLFLREKVSKKIEEHRFVATCMELKVVKAMKYPHSKLNVSNEVASQLCSYLLLLLLLLLLCVIVAHTPAYDWSTGAICSRLH